MKRSQANRAIVARRAAEKAGAIRSTGTVGTNPALRSAQPIHPMAAGPLRRNRCAPITAAQRNSEGRRSEWAASPYYFADPKWSRTVSDGINP